VPLTDVDKELLQRLVAKKAGAWNDFVDRYLSLIYHAIHHQDDDPAGGLPYLPSAAITSAFMTRAASHSCR
jgi:hypothetical protein